MWEIFAYQNSDGLFGIFNAIAAMAGANDYRAALAAVLICGFLAAALAYAFAPEKLQGWKWLASVVLVYSCLLLPKVTVGVVDKTGGAPVKVVDNVPLGLAALGGTTSNIGNTLTELTETTFQVIPGTGGLPSELTYQRNGLLFGNRLIRETRNIVFQDPNFRTDLINYIHNCTMYDLVDGTIDPVTFSRSDDVWSLMSTPNPARFTTLTGGGAVNVDTCTNAYLNLNGRIPAQLTRIQGKLAFQLHPTLPAAAAAAAIAGEIQQAYLKNQIATAAASAADIIRQNAMINVINDTSQIIGQRVNDPASTVLAVGRAQAVAQTNATWINQGKVAEQALPVIRNVIESLSYGLFLFFILLLLLTSGRDTMLAVKSYVSILIWIQLWPPLYAILNYMATLYAAADLASSADLGGGGKALSLQTASSIYSTAVSGEAIVGYLVFSIPFIAWAVLKRMENLGTALVGGLAGLQGSLSSSTGGAAAGNVSMGNVAMDQMQLAPNRTSAFMRSLQSDQTGDTFSSNVLNGRSAVNLLRNQGFISRTASIRVSNQDVAEANHQADTARTEAISAGMQRSAVLTDVFARGLNKMHSGRSSEGGSSSDFEQIGGTLQRLDQITKSVAERTGLSQAQVAQIGFTATGSLGFSTPVGGAQGQSRVGKSYLAGLSADQQKVLSMMTNEQLSDFKQFGNRTSHDKSFTNAISSDSKEANEISARLATTSSSAERAEAAFSERFAYAERVISARERGEAISVDLTQDPENLKLLMRYAEEYGGNSAAAFILFDSELARQSQQPLRSNSQNLSLPNSFESVRDRYSHGSAGADISGSVQSDNQRNLRTVSEMNTNGDAATQEQAANIGTRKAIETRGAEIQGQTQKAETTFDKNAEIKPADGTLSSERSLIKQAAKQVGKDGEAAAEAVQVRLKDIRKKLSDQEI